MSELGDKFRQFRDKQQAIGNGENQEMLTLNDSGGAEWVPAAWTSEEWPKIRVMNRCWTDAVFALDDAILADEDQIS